MAVGDDFGVGAGGVALESSPAFERAGVSPEDLTYGSHAYLFMRTLDRHAHLHRGDRLG